MYGEFLVNAQGEDVVAGIRTPQPISEMAEAFPEVYAEFAGIAKSLESITKICRTWSLPYKEESSICCRPETAREQPCLR